MKYEVLSEKYLEDLVSVVNRYSNEGWTPQGGVSIVAVPATATRSRYQLVCQALIKENKCM